MNTQTASVIFNVLRAIQILIVFICFIIEIVEYTAFQEFHADQGFNESDYFNGGITVSTKDETVVYYNGIKIFHYIALILTLIDGGFYLSRFCRYPATGPFKRDISINAFFMILWFTSGIANIYPSFVGYGFTCNNLPLIGDNTNVVIPNAIFRECNAKALNISFGWINGFLFLATTIMALRLWKERKERYGGERRVEALGDVVYKYKPRPNTIVQVDEPEQVMIYKTYSRTEMKRGTPSTYVIRTSQGNLWE
ncbi:hypothetical protein C1645_774684 [Glomus cerebriforme]|uniref:MARVEL domain-containing protein n=1 Tax=Glomus cerebriforme TaxID=658196 RepID=A0A397SRC9_9GLOM|nr:hypothetical protein C1645_774684 [Glomus cerebriforme]